MARRKAVKPVDVGQDFEKPERKKRETSGVTVYKVLDRPLGSPIDENGTVSLLAMGTCADSKVAKRRLDTCETGKYAVGRLTFLDVTDKTSVKKVVVRS